MWQFEVKSDIHKKPAVAGVAAWSQTTKSKKYPKYPNQEVI